MGEEGTGPFSPILGHHPGAPRVPVLGRVRFSPVTVYVSPAGGPHPP